MSVCMIPALLAGRRATQSMEFTQSPSIPTTSIHSHTPPAANPSLSLAIPQNSLPPQQLALSSSSLPPLTFILPTLFTKPHSSENDHISINFSSSSSLSILFSQYILVLLLFFVFLFLSFSLDCLSAVFYRYLTDRLFRFPLKITNSTHKQPHKQNKLEILHQSNLSNICSPPVRPLFLTSPPCDIKHFNSTLLTLRLRELKKKAYRFDFPVRRSAVLFSWLNSR